MLSSWNKDIIIIMIKYYENNINMFSNARKYIYNTAENHMEQCIFFENIQLIVV